MPDQAYFTFHPRQGSAYRRCKDAGDRVYEHASAIQCQSYLASSHERVRSVGGFRDNDRSSFHSTSQSRIMWSGNKLRSINARVAYMSCFFGNEHEHARHVLRFCAKLRQTVRPQSVEKPLSLFFCVFSGPIDSLSTHCVCA